MSIVYEEDTERVAIVAAWDDLERSLDLVKLPEEAWTDFAAAPVARALGRILREGREPSSIAVSLELNRMAEPNAVNVLETLAATEGRLISIMQGDFEACLAEVGNRFRKRQYCKALADLQQALQAPDLNVEAFHSLACHRLGNLARPKNTNSGWLAEGLLKLVEEDQRGELVESKVFSGLPTLDSMGGLGGTEIHVLAAWPKSGKTAFAFQWAQHISVTTGCPVYFESLEMAYMKMLKRAAIAIMQVPWEKRTDAERDHLRDFAQNRAGQVFIECAGGKLREFVGRTNAFMMSHPNTAAIFVDYLGLLQEYGSKVNSNAAANEVCDALKQLATRWNVPVIVLQQPNRQQLYRENKRPTVGDLRDTNKLLQDAHRIIFMHRPAAFETKRKGVSGTDPSLVEFHILANREGPEGVIKTQWIPNLLTFREWPKPKKAPPPPEQMDIPDLTEIL